LKQWKRKKKKRKEKSMEEEMAERLGHLFDSERCGVLATSGDGGPYTSLLAFDYSSDFKKVILCTARSTQVLKLMCFFFTLVFASCKNVCFFIVPLLEIFSSDS
jgi:hypothetical protein